jgi:hypothetical protein
MRHAVVAAAKSWITAKTRVGSGTTRGQTGGVSPADRDRFSIISDGLPSQLPDIDPAETAEWLESLDAIVDVQGRQRARYLMLRLLERARVHPVERRDHGQPGQQAHQRRWAHRDVRIVGGPV